MLLHEIPPVVCRPACRNHGTCTGPNRCRCARGWSGDHCQTHKISIAHVLDLYITDPCICTQSMYTDIHLMQMCVNQRVKMVALAKALTDVSVLIVGVEVTVK